MAIAFMTSFDSSIAFQRLASSWQRGTTRGRFDLQTCGGPLGFKRQVQQHLVDAPQAVSPSQHHFAQSSELLSCTLHDFAK